MRSISSIIRYILLALIVSTAVIYFVVASQEYSDLVDFLQVGIQGETQEKQVEYDSFYRCWNCHILDYLFGFLIRSKIPYIVVYLLY